MFPLRDENPTVHASLATFIIIGLNAAAWFLLQGFGSEPALSKSVCEYGTVPGQLLAAAAGASAAAVGPCVPGGFAEWLTPLTSMFMHGGWFHILGNMWFLAVFGDNVEDAMGHFRFVVFYLLCGFAAVAAQTLADPSSAIPMVGASGAIGGVMGAYAVLYPKIKVQMLVFLGFFVRVFAVPAILMLGYWLVIQFVGVFPALTGSGSGDGGGVAFWAHIGGFIAGVVLVFPFRNSARVKAHAARLQALQQRS